MLFIHFLNRFALLGCILLISILTPSLQAAPLFSDGGNSSGGGGPDQVNAGALKLLIEDGGLKRAMENYMPR